MSTQPVRLFRPSNSDAGYAFFDAWCRHCARDKAMREGAPYEECDDTEVCDLIGRSMLDRDHPLYPAEIPFDEQGVQVCTAFVPAGAKVPEIDTHTGDLFA